MTDRELLELAAKAAGIKVRWLENSCFGPTMAVEVEPGNPLGFDPWNPIIDDGDAERLAEQLDLNVERIDGNSTVAGNLSLDRWPHEPDGADRNSATRRAIVRAAAAIASQGEKRD
ncbi:hypothetical protein [Cupriavidus necator]